MKNKRLKSLRQAATILAELKKTSNHLMVKKQGKYEGRTIRRDPNSMTSIYARLKKAYKKNPIQVKKQIEGLLRKTRDMNLT